MTKYKTIIDLDFEYWKEEVDDLICLELELEKEEDKFTSEEKKKIKKIIQQIWLHIWDYCPHPNKLIEQAFKSFEKN